MKLIFGLLTVIIMLIFASCDMEVPTPVRDNPLDAQNPDTHGDPYNLQAEIAAGGVRLSWQAVEWEPLTGYNLYRKVNNGSFSLLVECALQRVSYTDAGIQNGSRYQYYVVARSAAGEGDASNVAKVAIDMDPVLFIEGENVNHTPTRDVTLTMIAYGAQRMILSNHADFTGAQWEIFNGTKQWQLTTGEGAKTVYMRAVYANGDTSRTVSDQIMPQPINPTLIIEHDSTHTSTRQVELTISAPGATEMKVSNSPFTGSESWIDYSESLNWELPAGAGAKTVYLMVRNYFLIEAEASDQIEPQPIEASIDITSDSRYINRREVTLSLETTGALRMKLANTEDSARVEWQNYAGELVWSLSAGDGWKHIYAWFKNDFFTTGSVTDSVGLDTRILIFFFYWISTGGDTLIPGDSVMFTMEPEFDAFGAETGGNASVTVEGWDPIDLIGQADGSYTGSYTITRDTPEVSNARVIVSFTDRAGNETAHEADQRLTAWWTTAPGTERDFPLGAAGQSITMCWIPPGSFDMGSPEGEQDRYSDEGPVHRVRFAEGFWMSKHEITQGQWEAVMGDNPAHGRGVGDDYPVYYVSWDDIQEFESALENTFRLPSEAEWEYACRAGTTTRFYWGDDRDYEAIDDYAVYRDNDLDGTANVGTKRPNAWGLYDMSGNVWEWCEDVWHDNYNGAPENGDAWVDGGDQRRRVLRGGSWISRPDNCRSAFRYYSNPGYRYYGIGFRLAY